MLRLMSQKRDMGHPYLYYEGCVEGAPHLVSEMWVYSEQTRVQPNRYSSGRSIQTANQSAASRSEGPPEPCAPLSSAARATGSSTGAGAVLLPRSSVAPGSSSPASSPCSLHPPRRPLPIPSTRRTASTPAASSSASSWTYLETTPEPAQSARPRPRPTGPPPTTALPLRSSPRRSSASTSPGPGTPFST